MGRDMETSLTLNVPDLNHIFDLLRSHMLSELFSSIMQVGEKEAGMETSFSLNVFNLNHIFCRTMSFELLSSITYVGEKEEGTWEGRSLKKCPIPTISFC